MWGHSIPIYLYLGEVRAVSTNLFGMLRSVPLYWQNDNKCGNQTIIFEKMLKISKILLHLRIGSICVYMAQMLSTC